MKQELRLLAALAAGLALGPRLSGPFAAQGVAPVSFPITAGTKELLTHLEIVYVDDGQGGTRKTIRVSGVNLQLVDGSGDTGGQQTGLGNLIVGYNEPRTGGANVRTGSHNLLVGRQHNYASHGSLLAGERNATSGPYAAVSGGSDNLAAGTAAAVCGGLANDALGEFSAVLGGQSNRVGAGSGCISGGFDNEVVADHGSVSGGQGNQVLGALSWIGGGAFNSASGLGAAVCGGQLNSASGQLATVGGGANRAATGPDDWRAGTLFETN